MFVWDPLGIIGIDSRMVCHHLVINLLVKPVSQRKREVGEEKRTTIDEDVQKLTCIGFIAKVKYSSWLADVVLVRNESNNWSMCVDFTNLDVAYLKDSYPFPNIDLLIDESSNYKILSFMDTYSKNNHIKMDLINAPKATFISNHGSYYYNVMPFGLKTLVPPIRSSWMHCCPSK